MTLKELESVCFDYRLTRTFGCLYKSEIYIGSYNVVNDNYKVFNKTETYETREELVKAVLRIMLTIKYQLMRKKLDKIEKLILKYGLVFDEETSRTNNDRRYTWNKNNTMITGVVLGIDVICGEGKGIMFAQDIHFDGESENYPAKVKCFSWEEVPEELWEEKLKSLKAEYDYAILRYKQYQMELKLKNIKKDFK